MKKELKQAIIYFIFENEKDFQLNNRTSNEFSAYMYDSSGNYLIGGEDVARFIRDAIKLLTEQ